MKNTLSWKLSGLFLIVFLIFPLFCPAAEISQKALSKTTPTKNNNNNKRSLIRSIEGNILKYNLKLKIWKREGYIRKFNELALARGSSLTNSIAEERAKLRLKRQKLTKFINYPQEAEGFLLRQMLNDFLKEEWNIELPQLPQGVNVQNTLSSIRILEMREDKKYIKLSLNAHIDMKNLESQLLELGYQFTPIKIQLYCSNLYGELNDKFINAVCRKSEYMKNKSGGFYEIYTTIENYVAELRKMRVGPYAIHIDEITTNKIIFSAEIQNQ